MGRNSLSRNAALVFMLAIPILLLSAISAFAEAGGPTYPTWDDTLPGNVGETSPHGSYSTATVKCAVCHAVHNANATGELLLQDTVANACTYCHVNSASAYTQVYDSIPANYSGTDYSNAHNNWVDGVFQGIMCTTCHQVHAAENQMTYNPFLTQKMLSTTNPDHPPFGPSPWDNHPNMENPLVGDDKETALTKWCGGCHFNLPDAASYYEDKYDGSFGTPTTHIMTTATAAYANSAGSYTGKVAWGDSNECTYCHSNGYSTATWPHYTAGDRFLDSGSNASSATTGAASSSEDGVCLRCHRGDSSTGIGIDF